MERITIENQTLMFGKRVLGPSHAVLVNTQTWRELEGNKGIVHIPNMPHKIDLLFSTEGHTPLVVGVEVKQIDNDRRWNSDLESSFISGKLNRQLDTIKQTCDVAALMVCTPIGDGVWWMTCRRLILARQLEGVLLLPGPCTQAPYEIVEYVADYRRLLRRINGPPLPARVDRQKPLVGDVPWQALASIRGMGVVSAIRLYEHYGSVLKALQAPDSEWKELGVRRDVIERRNKLYQ